MTEKPTPRPALGNDSFATVPVPRKLQSEIEDWWLGHGEELELICRRHGVSILDVRLPSLERLCYVLEHPVPKPHDSERSTD